MAGSGSLEVAPDKVIHEGGGVKPKLNWRHWDVGDARRGKLQATGEATGLLVARPQGQDCPSPLDLLSCHHIPLMLDMDLQDLVFALLGFGLVWV
jgi:hypothetical protein